MAVMLTSAFADLMDPSFREIYDNAYREKPSTMERIFKIETSRQAWEKLSSVTGLGPLAAKDEGADTTYDQRYQGYDKTFTHVTYALGFQITQEMIEDDLYGPMKNSPSALARSVRHTREVLMATHLNNAFATALADTKVLCASDHTAEDGSARTFSNLGSGVLSHTALVAARVAFQKSQDPRGLYIDLEAQNLIIPPDIEETGFILNKTERVSGSMNWDKSILAGSLNLIVSPYLTSTTAWFLTADKADHQLIFFDRVPPQFARDSEFDKDIAKWKVRMRCSSGPYGWRGTYGSTGA